MQGGGTEIECRHPQVHRFRALFMQLTCCFATQKLPGQIGENWGTRRGGGGTYLIRRSTLRRCSPARLSASSAAELNCSLFSSCLIQQNN